jgi:hypothetical protein
MGGVIFLENSSMVFFGGEDDPSNQDTGNTRFKSRHALMNLGLTSKSWKHNLANTSIRFFKSSYTGNSF